MTILSRALRRVRIFRLFAGSLAAAACPVVAAHGFGQRFDLPVPLWLWVVGAGATIILSFVITAMFVRTDPRYLDYPRVNLLRWRITRWLAHPLVVTALRVLGVMAFCITILTGLIGTPDPFHNLTPVMFWVVWWVGVAFVCALVGDLWALMNPLRTLFAWAETLYAHASRGQQLSLELPYPPALGAWPAVAGLVAFTWAELVWPAGDVPFNLGMSMVGYGVITWVGMFLYGREVWLQNGETFSVAFGVFARFAPLELRVVDRAAVTTCAGLVCRHQTGDCVNGYVCLSQAPRDRREWNLRPPAVGLLNDRHVSVSLMVFVLVMLSTVTFDGFLETPLWLRIVDRTLIDEVLLVKSTALIVFPLLFLVVFILFSWLMGRATVWWSKSNTAHNTESAVDIACAFVLTLVPIAIAYHLAHYLSYLLISGQHLIPIASDPFGFGWDLWGTAGFKINIGLISARFAWYAAVTAIVLGHVFAVYIAHVAAIRVFGYSRSAFYSQVPMVALMVLYTMVSLWILAQPITE